MEVQGEPDGGFERRLYVYNYRIYDRFSRDVVTLVVLTGDSPAGAPFRYEFGRWGFRHFFEFPAVKIMDYLYLFIDWVIALPEELAEIFTETIRAYEEELKVAYISSAERYGLKRGLQEGMEKGIEKGIEKGMEKGMEKGVEKNKRDTAKKMKEMGEPAEKIALYTGLSEEEIGAL